MALSWSNPSKRGPWGGNGGNGWDFVVNGTGITGITFKFGEVIDSISFKCVDANGKVTTSNKFGGNGGTGTRNVEIDWPKEYLIKISGTSRPFHNENNRCVESLCFQTNLKTYGPFGARTGAAFDFSMNDQVIVGFYGRAGSYINALGVYTKSVKEVFGEKVNDKIKMGTDDPREVGPWGGITGKPWDDGTFLAIKQVDVYVGKGIVRGIQVHYQSEGCKLVEANKRGGRDGDTLYRIKLDGEKEYLVGIMGFYGPLEENRGNDTVCSITLYTNKGKYGPYGDEIGMFFSSPASKGKVIGFHGNSGVYLDSIGVHMEY